MTFTTPVLGFVRNGETVIVTADGATYTRHIDYDTGRESWVEGAPIPRTQRAAQLPSKATPIVSEAA